MTGRKQTPTEKRDGWPCASCAVSMNDPNPECPSWRSGMGNHPRGVTRWSSSWDCPRCQADEHVCPGCGAPIAHAAGSCMACKEAL